MLPKQKISRKFLYLLIPSILIVFFITTSFITVLEYQALHKELINKGNDTADLYAITLEKPLWYIDAKQINQILDALLKDKEIVSIVLIVYTEGTNLKYAKNEHLISPALFSFQRDIFHQTTNQKIGNITFYLTKTPALKKIQETIIAFAVTMIILMITVIIISNLIQNKVIYKPIMNLLNGINQNISDNSYKPVAITADDEIGYLTTSFNDMMTNIKEYSANLEKMVTERELLLKELQEKNVSLETEIAGHLESKRQITIFKSLADAAGQGFGMSDLDGNLVYVNQALCQLLEETNPADIINKGLMCYYPEDIRQRMLSEVMPALKKTGQWIGESEYISARGKRIPSLENIFVIRDESGKAKVIAGVTTDISVQKQTEEEIRKLNEELEQRVAERTKDLEMTNKELESFSYSVSHDLRAPLRAIEGFSGILEREYGTSLQEKAQRYLFLVRDNVHRMSKLIEDMLSFSRMSRQALAKQVTSTAGIVVNALEELDHMKTGRKIEIIIHELPDCQADPGLLKVAYINLLSNAIKYTGNREHAVIEVGCRSENDENIFYVRDNGVGFDMKYVEKVFAVFQRLHSSTDFEGTGVGMSIVQRIINRHGGRIWADSEVGKGTTFYFTIGSNSADGSFKKILNS